MNDAELSRTRSDALGKFLTDNAALFGVTPTDEVELSGPEMFTGAILILRSCDTGSGGELMLSSSWPYALGFSEKIGMIERQRNKYRSE